MRHSEICYTIKNVGMEKYLLFNTEAHKVVGLFLSLQALFMSVAKLVCSLFGSSYYLLTNSVTMTVLISIIPYKTTIRTI